ncbi:hypothetical protein D3C85_1082820 [compost metagenome]
MVVVLAGNAAAVVLGIEVAGVDRQGPVTQGLGVLQAVETLLIDVLQLRLPEPDAGAVAVEGVVGAGVVEAVAGEAGEPRGVDRVVDQRVHLLVVGGVAQARGTELAGVQGQAGQLLGDQHGALVGRRQQAQVAEHQHWQVGLQLADLQLGVGDLQLERRAQAAVFVRRLAVAMHRQQPGAGAVRAAVELDAEQADQVDADADGAGRVAGTGIEDEALRPFLCLGLLVGADDVGEVAAEVVVARLQRGAGAFDEACLVGRQIRRQAEGQAAAEGAGEAVGMV